MRCRAAVLCAGLFCGRAAGQAFLAVPDVVSVDRRVFVDLLADARHAGLHLLVLGDSQEASPQSHGVKYLAALNAALAERFGPQPGTPLVQAGQTFGLGAPPAEWLVAGKVLWPCPSPPSPVSSAGSLPGLADWSLSAPAVGQRGWALTLQPAATGVWVQGLDRQRLWLDCADGVFVDVYCTAGSGPVLVRAATSELAWPDESVAPGGWLAEVPATPPDSPGPVPQSVRRRRFGPVAVPSLQSELFLQVEIVAADPQSPARLVGARFSSARPGGGVVASDAALGGYHSGSLVAGHGAGFWQLGGTGFGAVLVSYGANDASAISPAGFKQNTRELIERVRAAAGWAVPVILSTDPASLSWGEQGEARAEGYAAANAELAMELPAVCAVNGRAITHRAGWTRAGAMAFTYDGVHYNDAGALTKARGEVDALWTELVCAGDIGRAGGLPGADGATDANDLVVFIDAFFAGLPVADIGSTGGVAGGDGTHDANDFVVFIEAFFTQSQGC